MTENNQYPSLEGATLGCDEYNVTIHKNQKELELKRFICSVTNLNA